MDVDWAVLTECGEMVNERLFLASAGIIIESIKCFWSLSLDWARGGDTGIMGQRCSWYFYINLATAITEVCRHCVLGVVAFGVYVLSILVSGHVSTHPSLAGTNPRPTDPDPRPDHIVTWRWSTQPNHHQAGGDSSPRGQPWLFEFRKLSVQGRRAASRATHLVFSVLSSCFSSLKFSLLLFLKTKGWFTRTTQAKACLRRPSSNVTYKRAFLFLALVLALSRFTRSLCLRSCWCLCLRRTCKPALKVQSQFWQPRIITLA